MIFYVMVTIVSTVAFTIDIILRYMEKIRSFGMESRLHNIKGRIIPTEDFIPHNITLLCLFFMAFGTAGILLTLLQINALINFPVGVMCGMFTNFIAVRILRVIRNRPIPKNEDLSGTEAVCTSDIDGDGYGEIEFLYKNRRYTRPALSENETDIKKGENVLIIMMNEDLCFVEKPDEVINILNEKE